MTYKSTIFELDHPVYSHEVIFTTKEKTLSDILSLVNFNEILDAVEIGITIQLCALVSYFDMGGEKYSSEVWINAEDAETKTNKIYEKNLERATGRNMQCGYTTGDSVDMREVYKLFKRFILEYLINFEKKLIKALQINNLNRPIEV